jgi:hypothetical protein
VTLKWGLNRESALQDAGSMHCGACCLHHDIMRFRRSNRPRPTSFQAHLAQQLVAQGVVLVGVV